MMTDPTSNGEDIQLNRSLLVGGGVLVALGGLLGFTGMALVTSALLSAARRWVDRMEQPPSDIARRKWQQTRAAAAAGAAAWRDKAPNA
jgi:membrane protein implicated in regulation of membrane protease activity